MTFSYEPSYCTRENLTACQEDVSAQLVSSDNNDNKWLTSCKRLMRPTNSYQVVPTILMLSARNKLITIS